MVGHMRIKHSCSQPMRSLLMKQSLRGLAVQLARLSYSTLKNQIVPAVMSQQPHCPSLSSVENKPTTITYEEFERVNLRSGTIVQAEAFPKAKKPAFKVWADFGPEIGVLRTSAQITVHYTPDSLIGKQIVGCVNLGERNIAGFTSQFLLVGFADENGPIRLMTVDGKVPNGQKLH